MGIQKSVRLILSNEWTWNWPVNHRPRERMLNSLPTSLLHHITGWLDLQETVRLTFLSKNSYQHLRGCPLNFHNVRSKRQLTHEKFLQVLCRCKEQYNAAQSDDDLGSSFWRIRTLSLSFESYPSSETSVSTKLNQCMFAIRSIPELKVLYMNIKPTFETVEIQCLSNCKSLVSLEIDGSSQISGEWVLGSCSNLRSLSITRCKEIRDVSFLSQCHRLEELDLRLCKFLRNVSYIESLGTLTSLNLSRCASVDDVSFLDKLKNLRLLDLSHCGLLKDVRAIQHNSHLQFLNLSYCRALDDLSMLGALPELLDLNLSHCIHVTDLKPLQACKNLRSLILTSCWRVVDVNPLGSLVNLTALTLSDCGRLLDVDGLSGCGQLRELDLSFCDRLASISALASCKELRSLNLRYCMGLSEISSLDCLRHLSILNLPVHCHDTLDVEAALNSCRAMLCANLVRNAGGPVAVKGRLLGDFSLGVAGVLGFVGFLVHLGVNGGLPPS